MTATVATVAYLGLEARAVEVQVQLASGIPAFVIVGLPDKAVAESRERVQAASREIMKVCVAAGGSITGEHGVGSDKIDYMPLIFDAETLGAMQAVRRAFDPAELANPGKVVPVRACREWAGTPAARARQEVA